MHRAIALLEYAYLIDALDHLPNTMHYALACDANRIEVPLPILPWPSPAGRGRDRVKEVVALGLKSGAFALVMPMRPTSDHGFTP